MKPQIQDPPTIAPTRTAQAVLERLHISTTFAKFLIVGGIGYLVNQFTLLLVYDSPLLSFLPAKHTHFDLVLFTHPDIRLLIASVCAVEAAVVSNFYWHEGWTFRHRQRGAPALARFLRFNLTSIGSPLVAVASVNVLTPVFDMSPYIANTIGVALGTSWNWVWNNHVIWRR